MKPTLSQIFKKIKEPEPPMELESLILAKIKLLKEKKLKNDLIWSYFSLVGSIGAFALTIFEYGNTFLQSDFWVLLRLLLTDASLVLKNWGDFSFSLLETFPVFSATIMLVPVFLIMLSLSFYFKLVFKNNYNLHLT